MLMVCSPCSVTHTMHVVQLMLTANQGTQMYVKNILFVLANNVSVTSNIKFA